MSMSVVNGFICRDCADIAKAKRGENPAQSGDAIKALARAELRAGEARALDGQTCSAGRQTDAGARPSSAGRSGSVLGQLVDVTA